MCHYVAYLYYQIAKTDIMMLGTTQVDRLLGAILEPLRAYKVFLTIFGFLLDYS